MSQTPAQRAEAELTAFGLSLPETDIAPGFGTTRYMRVAGKGFAVFGDRAETADDFTLTVKLPISAEIGQRSSVRARKPRLVQAAQLGHRPVRARR